MTTSDFNAQAAIGADGAVTPGHPQPLGATVTAEGVNFSLFSELATRVDLLLFDSHDAAQPSRVITMDAEHHRSFHFWHCHVAGARPGQVYAYRVDGPNDAREVGTRFNPRKVLLDPYARANINSLWERTSALGPEDNCAHSMRSMVVDTASYDWEGDQPLRTPQADTIIYEMHVGGLTASPTSKVASPGTFSGVVEKIPYLQDLGITAVELLPVFDFDERQVLRIGPDGLPLRNYWGYDPFGFFAPHTGYCSDPHNFTHITEFRDMVKALHRAGIEVILDVVFNHTSEGNEHGPTISFRGQANEVFYHLWPGDRRQYMDFTGCGNAVNANHPAVAKFIIECLEYWVTEHHVDGFRFDLASELSRGAEGYEMDVPPVLWGIELSSVLAETKIIAEPWDGGGLYQVGRFPGRRWSQWNGPFRDEMRRFVRGDRGLVGTVATRIGGSHDLFHRTGELATNSINFITCHDGFSMNDLVSYNHRHNEANGEANTDGAAENHSWNCGVEGPSEDPVVEALRMRQIKNLTALLLLSRGVPMLLAGDEFRNTQFGNNNAYCQDSPVSWLDWEQAAKETEIHGFFKAMIEFRKRHPALRNPQFFSERRNERGLPDVTWHGVCLERPGWDDSEARVLSYTLAGFGDAQDLHVILNMYDQALDFELPQVPGHRWARAVDTAGAGGQEYAPPGSEPLVPEYTYHAQGRSVVVLIALPEQEVIPR
ncbi:glycogen debranching protein GlgX [Actinacidiphila bryophytorum]|uniref:glycogen debranching protein GlgX n=1 Tax=Actinacidiphila bryophytorum TaxID=1436133 RepID=UPI002176D442|nr:glycogen debranching protein GlgX [Actinacidiphila bryophytorum]UWE09207.1 glycogen debranching protein GlgX [Actinacidiphila bryophytorum]